MVGTSPLSPTAYFGAVQIDEVRGWLRANANEWLRATVAKYPDWIQALVRKQSDFGAFRRCKKRLGERIAPGRRAV